MIVKQDISFISTKHLKKKKKKPRYTKIELQNINDSKRSEAKSNRPVLLECAFFPSPIETLQQLFH